MSERLHPESMRTLRGLVVLHGTHAIRAALDQIQGIDAERSTVRHTACRFCGQDIEGIRNERGRFPAGEWRDRGNNRTCDGRRLHAPVREERTR